MDGQGQAGSEAGSEAGRLADNAKTKRALPDPPPPSPLRGKYPEGRVEQQSERAAKQ